MANATVSAIGQINGAGMTDALFLKLYGGEVLTAFETAQVTRDKHSIRSITSGKSAQFPATGNVVASYHVPGTEIVGQATNQNERVIVIDDLLIAPVFMASIDEAKAHYDVRGEYAKKAGVALANAWDKNVLQVGLLAARASATVTGGNGGTTLTSLTTLYKTSATDLAAGIYAATQAMDEKDIPEMDERFVFVKPAQYYLLAQSTALLNRDWTDGKGGNYADGKIIRIGGCPIIKSNNLPTTNISTGVATYQGDFSKTAALVMTKEAVGTVQLLDLATEMGYDIRRQGTLTVAKYAIGTGVLRPECSVELKTTA